MSYHAVVLDIEGTVGSATHVHDVLFPYARERLPGWFAEHRGTPKAAMLVAQVRRYLEADALDEAGAVAALTDWTDRDVKAPPLKAVQGQIWAAGYADGSLMGHVYDEVPDVLRGWKAAGASLYIYSSGSAAAQVDWFAHTAHGDLTPLFSGYFDLVNAGSKRAADSYRSISASIGAQPGLTLFLSDSAEELDAAGEAGWHTVGVRRPEDTRPFPLTGHVTVRSLDAQELRNLMKGTGEE